METKNTGRKRGNPNFEPKYSIKLQDFIVDKIEGGLTLEELCREYASVVPSKKTCNRWKKKYPEFKKAIDEAYVTLIFNFVDELNVLTKEIMSMTKELNSLDTTDIEYKDQSIKLKHEIESRKLRHKTLEFILTRIAPKLVPDLKEAPKSELTHAMPSINIISYATPKEIEVVHEATKQVGN